MKIKDKKPCIFSILLEYKYKYFSPSTNKNTATNTGCFDTSNLKTHAGK